MFRRIVALLCFACTCAFGQEITYDTGTKVLSIPSVQVGASTFVDVTLVNTGSFVFRLQGATEAPANAPLATYDPPTAVLTLPLVRVGADRYFVQMVNLGSYTFRLAGLSVVQTFTYFSKTVPHAQTATLANGTLTMDGIKITGFSFGASAYDNSGALSYWSAPGGAFDPMAAPAMLFCGADNKLAYVLIRSAADAPTRITALPENVLAAIHAEYQYTGIGIHPNCNLTFTTSWANNLPYANYFLWPDVFTTYSASYVLNQMNGAAIFFQPAPNANVHNYLVITWHGNSAFEVWE